MVRENRDLRLFERQRKLTSTSDKPLVRRETTNQSATNVNLLNVTKSPNSKIN